MPSNPGKYGIKIWMMADCVNHYVYNFQIYLGKENGVVDTNQGMRVVLRLSEPLPAGRNITFDNFFTSMPLAKELLKRNLTCIGTMRSNRKGIPKRMLPDKKREIHSSRSLFTNDMSITSYVPKMKKAVILLSTFHDSCEISPSSKNNKPEVINDYNKSKSGVDVDDQMIGKYTVKRFSRRWTMALFYDLINIAALNASRIFNSNSGKIPRKTFLQNLALQLIIRYAQRRLSTPTLPLTFRNDILNLIPSSAAQPAPTPAKHPKKRCALCKSAKDRKTSGRCAKCEKAICLEHSISVCVTCIDV